MSNDARQTLVVVGGGLAAGKAVGTLRDEGFAGRIVLFGNEPHPPYERPPLSKGYLMGTEQVPYVHPREWYDEHDVDLRLGATVTSLDPAARTVTAGSDVQPYDALLLATGAHARRLPMADDSGAPVHYLRTIEDSDRLRALLTAGTRLALVGGGWIGLEVAAAAVAAGAHVTVLESAELPLVGVLGPEVAARFARLHRDHGVDVRVQVTLEAIEQAAGGALLRLADGTAVEVDHVLVGIGAVPDTALAVAAGLTVDNGIRTDEHLRTSVPDIYAAGDVANALHPVLGRHVRVEHWDNAIRQGVVAARNLLGQEVPYTRMPYFFSDQYDLGLEYVGGVGPDGYDEVIVRDGADAHAFTAFWLHRGRVLAGMHANTWDATTSIKAIVGTVGVAGALRDRAVPLEQVVGLARAD
jgi:3-phenylpropionate/trans-cinnamate dioxygenase ferredoxin reductase subunit